MTDCDLPGLAQIPAPDGPIMRRNQPTHIGVGCPHALPLCANLHSARRSRRHPPAISRGFLHSRLSIWGTTIFDKQVLALDPTLLAQAAEPCGMSWVASRLICPSAQATNSPRRPLLHAAPLPTNVASMKSMVADSSIQVRWGGWRRRGGHKCAACLEGG